MRAQEAFMTGRPVTEGAGGGPVLVLLAHINPMLFTFALTCLYSGMRAVMRLGGFVAHGGPYEIAHPAPDWVLLFPLSIFLMLASIFISFALASRISGPNLMALSWSAIFTALGWNFLQFGFGIGMGGGVAVGWSICAIFFLAMGLVPLYPILRSFMRNLTARRSGTAESGREGLSWSLSLFLQATAAGAGVILGIVFFRAIA